MLSKTILGLKKSNNHLVVDKEAVMGQLRLLQTDYDMLKH